MAKIKFNGLEDRRSKLIEALENIKCPNCSSIYDGEISDLYKVNVEKSDCRESWQETEIKIACPVCGKESRIDMNLVKGMEFPLLNSSSADSHYNK